MRKIEWQIFRRAMHLVKYPDYLAVAERMQGVAVLQHYIWIWRMSAVVIFILFYKR